MPLSILGLLCLVLLWFMPRRMHYFTDFSVASCTDCYRPRPFGLLLHLSGGAIGVCMSRMQPETRLPNKHLVVHSLWLNANVSRPPKTVRTTMDVPV